MGFAICRIQAANSKTIVTMHYELKGRHEVCFKALIGLTGSVVNNKAKNLNFKALTTESKKF